VVLPYFCWLAGGKIVFPPLILFLPLCRGWPWRPALRRRVRGTPVMVEARSRSALASTTSMPSFPSSSSSSPQNPSRRRRPFSSNVISLSGVCAAVPAGHVPLSLIHGGKHERAHAGGSLMIHKYRGSQQSSREVLPKFIDSTQGEPKNICKP
jgi:hypothetical protein